MRFFLYFTEERSRDLAAKPGISVLRRLGCQTKTQHPLRTDPALVPIFRVSNHPSIYTTGQPPREKRGHFPSSSEILLQRASPPPTRNCLSRSIILYRSLCRGRARGTARAASRTSAVVVSTPSLQRHLRQTPSRCGVSCLSLGGKSAIGSPGCGEGISGNYVRTWP